MGEPGPRVDPALTYPIYTSASPHPWFVASSRTAPIIPSPPARVHLFLPGDPGRVVGPFERRAEPVERLVAREAVRAGVPLQLAQVLGAEMERMAVAFLERVGALHDAPVGDAMGDREQVAGLVGHELDRAAVGAVEPGERADARAAVEGALAEDE